MLETTGELDSRTTELASFVANLPELLVAMAADPRTLVAIAEFEDGRYLQFWAGGDRIVAEVVSNLNVPDGDALTAEQEMLLSEAGWGTPVPVSEPNWHREATVGPSLFPLALASADAAVRILGKGVDPGSTTVSVRTFPIPSGPRGREKNRVYRKPTAKSQ